MWKSRHTRGGVKRERRRRRNAKRLGEMKVPSVLMVLISQPYDGENDRKASATHKVNDLEYIGIKSRLQ